MDMNAMHYSVGLNDSVTLPWSEVPADAAPAEIDAVTLPVDALDADAPALQGATGNVCGMPSMNDDTFPLLFTTLSVHAFVQLSCCSRALSAYLRQHACGLGPVLARINTTPAQGGILADIAVLHAQWRPELLREYAGKVFPPHSGPVSTSPSCSLTAGVPSRVEWTVVLNETLHYLDVLQTSEIVMRDRGLRDIEIARFLIAEDKDAGIKTLSAFCDERLAPELCVPVFDVGLRYAKDVLSTVPAFRRLVMALLKRVERADPPQPPEIMRYFCERLPIESPMGEAAFALQEFFESSEAFFRARWDPTAAQVIANRIQALRAAERDAVRSASTHGHIAAEQWAFPGIVPIVVEDWLVDDAQLRKECAAWRKDDPTFLELVRAQLRSPDAIQDNAGVTRAAALP